MTRDTLSRSRCIGITGIFVSRRNVWISPVPDTLSNRTDSELIEKLRIILSRIDCGPQKSPHEQYTHWGAAIFCAHTLLVDVRATCPVWYGKAVRRKNAAGAITNRYPWRYLYTVVERLAEGLEATIPEVAELGTEIYLTVQN